MTTSRPSSTSIGCWFRRGLRAVAWVVILYIMAVGLQSCKATKCEAYGPAKFQSEAERQRAKAPKHKPNLRHKR